MKAANRGDDGPRSIGLALGLSVAVGSRDGENVAETGEGIGLARNLGLGGNAGDGGSGVDAAVRGEDDREKLVGKLDWLGSRLMARPTGSSCSGGALVMMNDGRFLMGRPGDDAR